MYEIQTVFIPLNLLFRKLIEENFTSFFGLGGKRAFLQLTSTHLIECHQFPSELMAC